MTLLAFLTCCYQTELLNQASSLSRHRWPLVSVASESVPSPKRKKRSSVRFKSVWPPIFEKDIRIPLHQEAKDQDCADVLIGQALKGAWDAYFEDVDGPIRSLQDIVDWHSQHPVSHFARSVTHM
jgi:hypothetical protein